MEKVLKESGDEAGSEAGKLYLEVLRDCVHTRRSINIEAHGCGLESGGSLLVVVVLF